MTSGCMRRGKPHARCTSTRARVLLAEVLTQRNETLLLLLATSGGAAGCSRGFNGRLQLCRRTAASGRAGARLSKLRQSAAIAVHGRLLVSEERFPRYALRIGDPLLVRLGVAADRALFPRLRAGRRG